MAMVTVLALGPAINVIVENPPQVVPLNSLIAMMFTFIINILYIIKMITESSATAIPWIILLIIVAYIIII